MSGRRWNEGDEDGACDEDDAREMKTSSWRVGLWLRVRVDVRLRLVPSFVDATVSVVL